MAKIRLGWPWKGTVLRSSKEIEHQVGSVVDVDDDTARQLVRRGLARRVQDEKASATVAETGSGAADKGAKTKEG